MELKPTFYIPIQGTHGWDEDPNNFVWWENKSVFSSYLRTLNLFQLLPEFPFEWSTDLNGIWKQQRAWKGAAKALQYYLSEHLPTSIDLSKRNLIAHSHGGQVVFYACSWGMKINNLITVGTPVRADMDKVIKLARPFIKHWLHIYDSKNDFTSILGSLFDGIIRIKHGFELADKSDNCNSLGISHSKILNDPSKIPLWDSRGWAAELTLV